MNGYFEADNARHMEQREKVRSEYRIIDISYIPELDVVIKVIGAKEDNVRMGIIYLSVDCKMDLDRCEAVGKTCYLRFGDVFYKYSSKSPWQRCAAGKWTTRRWRIITTQLTKVEL
jgi:hypothetical protein